MRGKHGRKQSDVVKVETFNSLKNQLELENAALMRERVNIQQQSRRSDAHTPPNLPFADIQRNESQPGPVYAQHLAGQQQAQHYTVDVLRGKIFEIIKLCQEQGDSDQLHEVIEAEKHVLTFLDGVRSVYEGKRATKEVESPAERSSRKKKSKLNKTTVAENNKESYYNISGDEAMEMIEEIERKALVQIENLRADKINLLRKLNEEIKAHNRENKLRISLENKLRRLEANGEMEVVAEESEESLDAQTPNQAGYEQPSRPVRSQAKSPGNSNKQQKNMGQVQLLTPNPLPNVSSAQNSKQIFHQQGEEIMRQIERLNNQNQKIKAALSSSHPSLKNKLKLELSQLEGKVRHYQQVLAKYQKPGNIDLRELEILINQANSINEQGGKLLKTKRVPEYRTTLGSEEEPNRLRGDHNPSQAEQRATFDYSRPPLQTFSPLDKSYHSQTYKSGFSPTKYENLIQEMNRATKV